MFMELKGSKNFYNQDNSLLTIHYFLVQSLFQNKPIYGIQIQSYWNHNLQSIHSEIIPHISYSSTYVNRLVQLCMTYSVTPTDLFSSLDILMDTIKE